MSGTRFPAPMSADRVDLWSSLAHFGNLLGFLPSLLIMTILGPRSARVREEARQALNFSLTALIVWVGLYAAGLASNAVYRAMPPGVNALFFLIGTLITLAQFAVWLASVVLSIRAGIRANQVGTGLKRYPFSFRIVR